LGNWSLVLRKPRIEKNMMNRIIVSGRNILEDFVTKTLFTPSGRIKANTPKYNDNTPRGIRIWENIKFVSNESNLGV
jgi:hypothetical protein